VELCWSLTSHAEPRAGEFDRAKAERFSEATRLALAVFDSAAAPPLFDL